ncbi:MAG: peptide chain release factor N(5)-glutamine methyltransferase [Burkholderiales bacterium]|nr:peptide chain release factor N(5)-glutamine methyltransferase [Burkholderiales bacterium]
MNIRQALAAARAAGVDRLDAQLLLGALTGRDRAALIAHDEAELDTEQARRLATWTARRAAGEPLAYVTGRSEFRGLTLDVSPATLIPRPETELLVEWGLACLAGSSAPAVVDLGTGSGAIALAIKDACRAAQVCAGDCSAEALAVARGNGTRLGLEVEWLLGDWWQPLQGRRFALALANPPYVAGDDPHLAALRHEPRGALTPEGDGLAALRRIVDGAPGHLLPGAWLLLEHGHDQADAVARMLAARGFGGPRTRHDLAGMARCTGAIWCA